MEVAILLGQVERIAERLPAGNDGHLLQLRRAAHEMRHERVASLVIREDAAFLLGQHLLLLQAGDDALEGPVEVERHDDAVTTTACRDSSLVADIREFGAGEAGGLARDGRETRLRGERLATGVNAE